MEKTVTESIWSNEFYVIPFPNVSHIEKLHTSNGRIDRIFVFFKYSKWDDEVKILNPHVYLENKDGLSFKQCYCNYISELEDSVTLRPYPDAPESLKGFYDSIQSICKEHKG